MTELEKIQYLNQKYATSTRLYTVYSRVETAGHYTFSLIYGTDKKKKVQRYVAKKEQEGLFLIVYLSNQKEQHSRCVFVSGMENALTADAAREMLTHPVRHAMTTEAPLAAEARG